MTISRREFIQYGVLLVPAPRMIAHIKSQYFQHGIASGDPLQDKVIIWTRITEKGTAKEKVYWEIALDEQFTRIQYAGNTSISQQSDYTVKVDVNGLSAGEQYFYRFKYRGQYSPIGKTKTLPNSVGINGMQVAVVSCNNWEDGYFNSFRFLSTKQDVDVVLHLGDYIYEYGTGEYGNPVVDRKNFPGHEIITLGDYRKRYAQYRTDIDLQALHASKPFIMIWDDHEIANDAYADGAKNHQSNEGDYQVRKQAAIQAYLEWLPVRARNAQEMRRSFTVGNDFQLLLTEQRATARTCQLRETDKAFFDSNRSLVGGSQLEWLCDELKASKATWKFIGNQVMFTGYKVKQGFKSPKVNDWWLGYPVEQKKLVDFLSNEQVQNVVFLTGDHHESFVLAMHKEDAYYTYKRTATEKPLAWEFLTPSITSRNGDRLSAEEIVTFEEMLHDKSVNPHLVYGDIKRHGYLLLDIYADRLLAQYCYVDNILTRDASETVLKAFELGVGDFVVREV
ncbi:alkaline phosphatase D family protein [Chitinophaga skermanii]|nr:alkaline phosphatase D family protein [Chitinophaga skermanii]